MALSDSGARTGCSSRTGRNTNRPALAGQTYANNCSHFLEHSDPQKIRENYKKRNVYNGLKILKFVSIISPFSMTDYHIALPNIADQLFAT